jgi:hypothetical protein
VTTSVGRKAILEHRQAQSTIHECHHANQTELHHTGVGCGSRRFAIVVAPIAAAAAPSGPPSQSCGQSGAGTECQSPGNVEINDSPPPVSYYPYGGDAFLLGGYGYGGGHVAGVTAVDTGNGQ